MTGPMLSISDALFRMELAESGWVPNPWLHDQLAGCDVWLTYDGASLHYLLDVQVDDDGQIIVDLERVAA